MALESKIEFGTAAQPISADEDYQLNEVGRKLKVNIACGQQQLEGFTNMDIVRMDHVDVVHDALSFPWPFADHSVFEFRCEHFVEHIPHQLFDENGSLSRKNGLILFMEEVYRCLMPGGIIQILAPYYTSIRAHQDPTHCRYVTDMTFEYFNRKGLTGAGLDHYEFSGDFEIMHRRHILDPEYVPMADEARRWAMRHYWNVVQDFEITMRALK